MANNVATPLERQFMQIPGLELITSSSNQGNTSFTLQFSLDKSMDGAATDVQAAITRAQGSVAAGSAKPTDVHQDQSQRSTADVSGGDEQHPD